MLDRIDEPSLHPRAVLQVEPIDSVLCVAPHPDDEVLGCAGLLLLLQRKGCEIHTLILTNGEAGSASGEVGQVLATQRQQESLQAAALLKLPAPEFAGFPDRGLSYALPLISRLEEALRSTKSRCILLPALSEPHPDHQATALAGLVAATNVACVHTILFYEVGAPTLPNCFVDISTVAATKWLALAAFCSQMGLQRYEAHAQALATLRAFGIGGGCSQAEAFFKVDVEQIRRNGPAQTLSHWPLQRQQHDLANTPQQLPLVSVLVRSMDRAHLPEALASILVQTYSNIEIVVANASGHPHSPVTVPTYRTVLRVVAPAPDQAGMHPVCSRSQAANIALGAARGDFALFLDDDDLIDPRHIERLVAALTAAPNAVGAYTGIRVEGPGGTHIRDYDLAWSLHRLNAINFLPIHAVLFKLSVVRNHSIAFDDSLPVLEDWQFWRNLCHYGPLHHCPGVSGRYRQGLGDSQLGNAGHAHYWKNWHYKLVQNYVQRAQPQELGESLAWHAIELDRTQALSDTQREKVTFMAQELAAQRDDLRARYQEIETLTRERQIAISEKLAAIQALTEQLSETRSELHWARGQVQNMQNSLSWRLTTPLRQIKRWLGLQ